MTISIVHVPASPIGNLEQAMADLSSINDLLRRAAKTNIGFYEDLVQISADYLKNLSAIFDEEQEPGVTRSPTTKTRTKKSALVLEAQAGERAESYFVVENQLSRKVPAEIIASPIVDAKDEVVKQKLQFEPSKIDLEPGQRIIVQVMADIDQSLEPGVGYRGSITVPGLSDSPVAIVLRRLHSDEKETVVKAPRKRKKK